MEALASQAKAKQLTSQVTRSRGDRVVKSTFVQLKRYLDCPHKKKCKKIEQTEQLKITKPDRGPEFLVTTYIIALPGNGARNKAGNAQCEMHVLFTSKGYAARAWPAGKLCGTVMFRAGGSVVREAAATCGPCSDQRYQIGMV
eukprot:7700561-Pyramimonas_sp.AAC.2